MLCDNCLIIIKTDNDGFYDFSLESILNSKLFKILFKTNDLYSIDELKINNIKTEYENNFLKQNKKIKYIKLIKNIKT